MTSGSTLGEFEASSRAIEWIPDRIHGAIVFATFPQCHIDDSLIFLRHLQRFSSGNGIIQDPEIQSALCAACGFKPVSAAGCTYRHWHGVVLKMAYSFLHGIQLGISRVAEPERTAVITGTPFDVEACRNYPGVTIRAMKKFPAFDYELIEEQIACEREAVLQHLQNRIGQQSDGRSKRNRSNLRSTQGKRKSPDSPRNKWIYNECCKGIPYSKIIYKLKTNKPKNWERINSVQGIRAAAIRYAKSRQLPHPPKRLDDASEELSA